MRHYIESGAAWRKLAEYADPHYGDYRKTIGKDAWDLFVMDFRDSYNESPDFPRDAALVAKETGIAKGDVELLFRKALARSKGVNR